MLRTAIFALLLSTATVMANPFSGIFKLTPDSVVKDSGLSCGSADRLMKESLNVNPLIGRVNYQIWDMMEVDGHVTLTYRKPGTYTWLRLRFLNNGNRLTAIMMLNGMTPDRKLCSDTIQYAVRKL